MRKVYLAAIAGMIGVSAMAQKAEVLQPKKFGDNKATQREADKVDEDEQIGESVYQKAGAEVYWAEDFSNGFDGVGDNGAWTTMGAQGDLWFITFPVGTENGYDPDSLNGPNDNVPNWFGGSTTLTSTTSSNGFAMLDADAFNSTADPGDTGPGGQYTTNNTIEASLVSPSIDLEGNPNIAMEFSMRARICCSGLSELFVGVSPDGGASWTDFSVYNADAVPINESTGDTVVTVNLAQPLTEATTDLSDVKVRFRWPSMEEHSHYVWMVDDISLIDAPNNELILNLPGYDNYLPQETWEGHFENMEYTIYGVNQVRPLSFRARVNNNGIVDQTGVTLNVNVTMPDGSEQSFSSEPLETLASFEDSLLTIDEIDLWDGMEAQTGTYSISYNVTQNEDEQIPINNNGARSFMVSEDEMASDVDDGGGFNFYEDIANGGIYTMPFVPVEEQSVNSIGFVLYYEEGDEISSQDGALLFLNIREGNVLEDDNADLDTGTLLFDEEEISYISAEEDMWNNSGQLDWIWVDLPEAVTLEPGNIYQAEITAPEGGATITALIPCSNQPAEFVATGWDDEWLGLSAEPHIRYGLSTGPSSLLEAPELDGVSLGQNFPNPAVSQTTVEVQVDKKMELQLEVYDQLGRVHMQRPLGNVTPGTYQHNISTNRYESGVYYYSIVNNNGQRVTRSMIINK